MAFDYAEIAELSLELLTEFGQDVTRVAYSTDMYAEIDGEVGSYISTDDTPAASVTSDITLIAWVAADDWTPSVIRTIISKYQGGQRSYLLDIQAAGIPRLLINKSSDVTATSTASVGFVDGTGHWIRGTWDDSADTANFFTSDDPYRTDIHKISWTQLGDADVSLVSDGINDSTGGVEIGTINTGAGNLFSGKIARAVIIASTDPTVAPVVDYNANDYDTGLTQTSSATSEVWAYNGGVIVPGYNPATGITPLRTDSTTRKGALFSFGDIGRPGEKYVRGQQIEVADKRLLVDAEAGVNLKDHFIVDSVEYTIVSVDEVSPAGTAVLYDLHLRVG